MFYLTFLIKIFNFLILFFKSKMNNLYKIIIKILDYGPRENNLIPFNDMFCIFEHEKFEEKIYLNNISKPVIYNFTLSKIGDIKIKIKIFHKLNLSLIGMFEYIIPFNIIEKLNVSKQICFKNEYNLIMLESTKNKYLKKNAKEIYFNIESLLKIKNNRNNSFIFKNYDKLFSQNNNMTYGNNNSFIHKNNNIILKNNKNKFLSKKLFVPFLFKDQNKKNKNIAKTSKKFFDDIYLNNSEFNYNNDTSRYSKEKSIYNKLNNNCKQYNSIYNTLSFDYINTERCHSQCIDKKKIIKKIKINKIINETKSFKNKSRHNYYNYFNYENLNSTFNKNYSKIIFNIKNYNDIINLSIIKTNENVLNNFERKKITKIKVLNNIKYFLKFQKKIKEKFKDVINQRNNLIKALLKNYENYKNIYKQKLYLNTLLNTNKIIVNKYTKNSNKIINTKLLEIKIFNEIINLKKLYEIKKEDKLKFLLKVTNFLINKFGNISQFYEDDEDSKIILKALLFRYKLIEKNDFYITNDLLKIIHRRINSTKIRNINEIKEVNEEEEETLEDNNDNLKKLNEYLEKKFPKIKNKFKKINENLYKFDNKILKIKFEKNSIFVFYKNKFINLNKFIEINYSFIPLIKKNFNNIKTKNLNNKSKNNSMKNIFFSKKI